MSELAALQRLFAAVLMDGAARAPLEAMVRGDARADAAERVAIYADMYRFRLVDVLAEVYPRTCALLGEAFGPLADAYVRAHPSRSPSLRSFGDRWSEHLACSDAPACAPSLALLEWTRYQVFDAPDQQPLTRERLAGLDGDAIAALPLRTLLASRLIHCTHDADALYRALADEGARVPEAPATPTHLLVWRDALTVYHRVLPPGEALLLQRVSTGTTLGQLCEAVAAERADQPIEATAAEVFALVGRWIADRVIGEPSGSIDLRDEY